MVRSAGVRTQASSMPDGRRTGVPGTHSSAAEATADQQSLGDLVALAAKDMSQLVRYEIDLAKTELRADMKRAAVAAALLGFAAFIGCLVLVLLTFALALGLHAAGVPGGGGLYVCFVYAAIICILIAAAMIVLARFGLTRFSKMKDTRKTVGDDLDMLRRRDGASPAVAEGSAASLASDDGTLEGTRVAAELPEGTPRDGRTLRR
jgi:Putative Actinobacterial Holin-X, holin superfamily III